MKYYCTVFDAAYLNKGMALFRSLERHHSEDFLLMVLALDMETYDFLIKKTIGSSMRVFPPAEDGIFQTMLQKFGKPAAYWAMASQWMAKLLYLPSMGHMTYLDADLYFFSDPKVIFEEIGSAEVAICPHRFPKWDAERLRSSGQYNVGWVYAKKSALEHIQDWAAKVREKCDAETCGDQKYLDEWPIMLGDKLCVIENRGVDVAPWNVGRFDIMNNQDFTEIWVSDTEDGAENQLVFYHFHEHKSSENRTGYKLGHDAIALIYEPYEKELEIVKNL